MQAAVPIRFFSATHRAAHRLTRSRHLPFDAADFSPALQTRLLVLQPTAFCNLDCSYCYLPDRDNRERMSLDTMRLALRRLVEDGLLGEELTIAWHAGEPLVLPPDYYEAAFATVAELAGSRCRIIHAFQTNGTLIDRRWCEFFVRHAVRVGISIDGPADLHDRHRRTRTGTATHAKATEGLRQLRESGVAVHAIAVLGRESLARADDLHDFFTAAGVAAVGYNFDEAEGAHAASSLATHEVEHDAFLARTLTLALQSGGRYRVRELATATAAVANDPPTYLHDGRSRPLNAQVVPFSIISIASNGDFCTFSPELLGQRSARYGNFVLGNVAAGGYLQAASGEAFERLWADVRRGVDACEATCPYFRYCGGGAPANKLYENGSPASGETLYCRTMIKRPFETVLRALEPGAPACARR